MRTLSLNVRTLVIIFWFCQSIHLMGQEQHVGIPEIISLSKTDYQGGTQNWSAAQSASGLLYVGNNKGVLEFDGTRWQKYPTPNLSIVKSLAADPTDSSIVYVGAQGELGYLQLQEQSKSVYVSLTESIPESERSFADVWKIFPRGEEGVFFCAQGGLYIWRNSSFEIVYPAGRFEHFFEIDGELYTQDMGIGLLRWDGKSFLPVTGGDQFSQTRLAAILPHPRGKLLFTDFQGLFLMTDSGILPWETPSSSFLRESHAYCAIVLSDGRYAVGTVEHGLLLMNQEGYPLLHLDKSSGLQNSTVLMLFEDREKNLWLGLDNGIDYLKISAPFNVISSASGIEGTGYTSILYQNHFYIGTNQGLFHLDWTEVFNPLKPRHFERVQGIKGQVWSLQELGGVLMAGMHEGTFRIEGDRAYQLSSRKGAWKFLVWKDNPNYALGGTYTGVALYQKQDLGAGKSSWSYVKMLDGFDESARIMELDEENFLWVSHAYKGVFRLKLEPETFDITETRFYNSKDGFPFDISIHVTKIRGKIIFNTPRGVYLYDKASNRFVPDETFNEIFGNAPRMQHLTEDAAGNIWFSVNDQFGVLNLQNSGLLGDTRAQPLYFDYLQERLVDGFEHIYALDSQHVFIGTENGFVHYNPSIEDRSNRPFNALIRCVEPEGVAQGTYPPNLKEIRFTFSAPYFEHLNKMQYRYSLLGFEEEWSDWGTRTERAFVNLPHGRYTFRVEAKNTHGQNSEISSYSFTIEAPWYASTTAKVVYALLGILSLLLLGRLHERRLEKHQRVLREEQAKQLAQMDEELKETQEQSEAVIEHLRNENLHNTISHKNAQLASATMHLVQKGEILLKLKRDLSKMLSDVAPGNRQKVQQLINAIDENIRLDDDWEQFAVHFDQVHENFLQNLQNTYPQLTPKDLKLCAYLRMNLSTKEIAPLLNISVRGVEVSRYRLRKKLDLETDTNLVHFIMKF